MKKVMLFLSVMAVFGCSALYAAAPVIFFSDLTSGPKTGGQNNKGLFVTIVGKNFGASRGTNAVSIGGGLADNYPLWSDTKICFQLGANANTGNITVATPDGTSNGIHFTVRSGNIYFVDANSPNSPGSGTFADPWRSPASYFTAERPGDTCYFRAGLYSGQYGNSGRPYNVSFYNSGIPSGSLDNEIAWVGYPGETALFKADDNTVYNGAFEFLSDNQYFVVAGLSIYGRGDGREQVRMYSDNDKLVNCKIEGIKTLSYAMVGITGSHLKIWGNECFGATSQNKLDHIFYFQSPDSDVDIGWNYVHDNDIAVGPMFSWNITGSADNIVIHDNKLDCRNSSDIVRLAGIWNGTGGSITFTNNLIIGSGGSLNDDTYNAIYIEFANVKIYHNTFYLCHGAGSNAVVHVYGSGSADVRNNIFYNQNNITYVTGNATVANNCYFGGNGSVPSGDAHTVTADPKFVNAGGLDFHLASGSPVIGKGGDVTATAPRDYDGVFRIAGAVDLGAFQYGPAASLPPTAGSVTHAIRGVVVDSLGKIVAGVTMTLSGAASQVVATAADGSYVFTALPENGAYTVTPSKDHWKFDPLMATVAALSADITGQNFTGTLFYTISGHIKDLHSAGVPGVTVTLSGGAARSMTTDSNGAYQFADLPAHGAYTVTPSMNQWQFSPTLFKIGALESDLAATDFTGRRTYSIKGYIKDVHGTTLKGAAVELTGGGFDLSHVTDDSGYYEFLNLPESNDYKIKSNMSGYYFSPVMRSTSTLAGYIDGWNFEGAYVNSMLGQGEMKVVGSYSSRGTINPDKGETPKIYFKGNAAGKFECRIFTLTGDLVWTSSQDNVSEGTFDWPANGVASGIYTACVKGPGLNTYKKIAIVR